MGYSPPFLTSSGVFIGPSSTRSAGPPRVDFCLGVLIALSDPDLSLSLIIRSVRAMSPPAMFDR